MADVNVRLPDTVLDRMKAHMRGGESYADFLNATLDYMEGTGSILPWPRRSLALWRQMRAQGQKELGKAMHYMEADSLEEKP